MDISEYVLKNVAGDENLRIDTTPGCGGVMAPPAGWSGDAAAYRGLMQERLRDRMSGQQIVVCALNLREELVAGPFREQAIAVLKGIRRSAGETA